MADVNMVVMTGKVIADPIRSKRFDGSPLMRFEIAVENDNTYGKTPNTVVVVEGYKLLAELIERDVRQGSQLLIQGRLRVGRWEAKDDSPFFRLGVQAT